MRTGVEFISSCACMDIIIVPLGTMFDRANSNVKLASSSRVYKYWSARVENEYERSSARVRVRALECSSARGPIIE